VTLAGSQDSQVRAAFHGFAGEHPDLVPILGVGEIQLNGSGATRVEVELRLPSSTTLQDAQLVSQAARLHVLNKLPGLFEQVDIDFDLREAEEDPSDQDIEAQVRRELQNFNCEHPELPPILRVGEIQILAEAVEAEPGAEIELEISLPADHITLKAAETLASAVRMHLLRVLPGVVRQVDVDLDLDCDKKMDLRADDLACSASI
jgi:hypothetical protein